MTRRLCSCRMCVKAIGADSAGLRTAAIAYRSLCLTRRAERRALYTRQAAAAAERHDIDTLPARYPAPSTGDTP